MTLIWNRFIIFFVYKNLNYLPWLYQGWSSYIFLMNNSIGVWMIHSHYCRDGKSESTFNFFGSGSSVSPPEYWFFFYIWNYNKLTWFLIFFSLIFEKFWGSPLIQFSKFTNFHWECWFLGKNLSNFTYPIWKLHNQYCHNV